MAVIETKNLTKSYGKSRGIIDLNLTVDEGDIFGFIGPNGAGKSTTIRSLLGLITPTSGSAFIFGKDCVKGKDYILKNIGYMPSEASFYRGMSVSDTIKLSADLRKKDCSKSAKELCDRFGIDTKKKVEELSLGNRRKVSIVCAMQHNPELCIFDEPTSGLDPLMQKEFFNLLHERNKSGTTIFLSSHVLFEIQKHCHRAGVVREGKLITIGTVKELTKSSAKRVTAYGINTAPLIDGIINPQSFDDHINFLYSGEISKLIAVLNNLPITDVNISEPDLEEMFMHFYGGETK